MTNLSKTIIIFIALLMAACGQNQAAESHPESDDTSGDNRQTSAYAVADDNGSIILPDGFRAVVVADNLGKARHITVRGNGDIYIKLRQPNQGAGMVALRDTTGDGKADVIKYFGAAEGGTGIHIHEGYLYYSSDREVFRQQLDDNLVPQTPVERIVTDLPQQRSHEAKPLAFDAQGNLYINVGAPSNACQEKQRTPGSPGLDPCPQLEKHGGIWKFSASAKDQLQAQAQRYATGMRQIVAMEWNNADNTLYAVQHGRDQLHQLWPDHYSVEESAELPAEEFIRINEGDNFGWPYCYYDQKKNKKVLAPEYGGNGEEIGRCNQYEDPIVAFPGHWAPNDLIFYNGSMFPEKYKNGALVAFHGSWNRAPRPQQGYKVVFVPFDNGKPAGDYETFADQFAGSGGQIEGPGDAEYRPMGLAEGPDGSLYITDSQQGRVWRVIYDSDKS